MANIVRFKKSNVPGKVPSVEDLSPGEIAINTFDGKLFTKQQQGAVQKIVEIGAMEAENVLYVSKSGDDSNDGKTLGKAKLTVKAALAVAKAGTTIFVKSGEFIEENPMTIPARVAIVGDSLRTTTIRPANPTQDIFWVNNGSYVFQLNFKGHLAPSAAVAFPPDGSAGYIVYSPYVQAVTCLTSTGTGMRVDGSVVSGLRSMVVDAFTQYNQGGVGIHMLNRGYTQLVSVFTICTDIGFLCEDGGFCSIANSNSSFGTYGLVARGASPALYFGATKDANNGREITVKNLPKRPNVGDSVLFADYNQELCARDTGYIVDSLAFDLLYGGSTQSTYAGLKYWGQNAVTIPGEVEETVAALEHARSVAEAVVRNITVTPQTGNIETQLKDLVNPGTLAGARTIGQDFELITNIIQNGPKNNESIIGPDITVGEPERRIIRDQILNAKADIEVDLIDYINTTYPALEYDEATCVRDAGYIIEAVTLDLVLKSNYQSQLAGLSYIQGNGLNLLPTDQVAETIDAIGYLKDRVLAVVEEDSTQQTELADKFDIILDILNSGSSSSPVLVYGDYKGIDQDFIKAKDILQANKAFFKAEITAFIAQNFPSLVYDEDVCERDVGYVVDALCYDIMYGGNSAMIRAGMKYFSYVTGTLTINPLEKPATKESYIYLQRLTERAVINDTIVPLQNVISQNTANPIASLAEVTRITRLFLQFLDVLDEGITGETDTIISGGRATEDVGTLNTAALLQANKNFIIEDTVAYINQNFVIPESFSYDEAKCRRDLGWVIDSITIDLIHGGNRQSVQAGVYYYEYSSTTTVIPGETKQTANALTYLKSIVRDVVTNTPTPVTWQTSIQQITNANAGTSAQADVLDDRLDLISAIILDGPGQVGEEKEAIGTVASTTPAVLNAFELLLLNKDFIKAELVAYINKNWFELSEGLAKYYTVDTVTPVTLGTIPITFPDLVGEDPALLAARTAILNAKEQIKDDTIAFLVANYFDNFVFNKPKCYRDVGFIVEAVVDDIVFGTNYKSYIAGYSYLRSYSAEVIENQKVQTVAALKETKRITLELIVNTTIKTQAAEKFDIVINILDQGLSAIPTIDWPVPVGTDVGFSNAAAILQANKDFIVEDVIKYINNNLNALNYDQAKCQRDIGYIIEAVAYDYLLGTNYLAVISGESYLRGGSSEVREQPQKQATLDALEYLKGLILEQVAADSAAVTSATTTMDTIIRIIDTGTSEVETITFPNTAGASTAKVNAVAQLQQNRTFLQTELVTWIDLNFSTGPYVYDDATQVKCERDLGFILTAGAYDAALGTNYNSVTAGLAYWRANAGYVQSNQKTQTIGAIEFARDEALGVAVNATFETNFAAGLNEVVDIIDNGELSADALVFYSGSPNAVITQDQIDAKDKLQANRTFLQSELVAWIDDKFVGYTYGGAIQTKCERDLGYILDAVKFDLALDTNYNAVTAGNAYQREGALPEAQLIQTAEAIKFAKEQAADLITNGTALARSDAAFDEVLDLLQGGTANTLVFTTPSYVGFTSNQLIAKNALVANRTAIRNDVIAWITSQIAAETPPFTSGFTYDQAKCSRDVGYIVDALCYDILYLGNSAAVRNADAYFVGAVSQLGAGEKAATLAAYEQLKTIVKGYINISALNSRVDELLDVIIDHIDADGVPDLSLILVEPDVSWVATGLLGAYTAIDTNQATIVTATSTFITNNFDNFTYDSAKCSRDTGYIIDALSHDVLYGGNYGSIRCADAYFVGATSQLGAGETVVTVLAYERLKSLVDSVIRGIAITPTTGNTETQVTSGAVATATESARLVTLLDIIIDVIQAGNLSDLPATVLPNLAWTGAAIKTDADAIIAAIPTIQTATSTFINDTYHGYQYDTATQTKCERDLGFIIDSVAYDIALGTNYNSVTSGIAYQRANSAYVQSNQKLQTVEAIKFARNEATAVTTTSDALVIAGFDEVVDILLNGEVEADPLTFTTTGIAQDKIDAHDQLRANREFIQTEITAWIADQIAAETPPFVSSFTYDEAKCFRDVGYIVDALSHDILYGGNFASVRNADAYFVGAVGQLGAGETDETIAAYGRLKDIVSDIVRGILITKSSANTLTQDTSSGTATLTEATTLEGLIDIIITVLNDGNTSSLSGILVAPTFTNADATALLAAKATIISDTSQYILDNFDGFNYNNAKCFRDIGFIIDGLCYDLLYGNNAASVINAAAYYIGATSQLGAKESAVTVLAYEQLDTLISDVIQGIAITPTAGNTETQITSGGVATATEAAEISADLAIVTDVIRAGNLNNIPDIVFPSVAFASSDLQDLHAGLLAYIPTARTKTIDYINNRPRLVYDEALCRRDTGFIVDAVAYDMMFNSNFRSIKAAEAYYRSYSADVLNTAQKAATLGALNFIKTKLLAIVADDATGTGTVATATTRVTNSMNLIINIFDNGLGVIPALSYPEPTGYSETFRRARNLINNNREFINEEIEEFMTLNYPNLEYDRTLCRRDVNYIIDALVYDLNYGGNSQSYSAGIAYYSGTQLFLGIDEKEPTLAAYGYLVELVSKISQNIPVVALQPDVAQVTGLAGSSQAAAAAVALVEDIRKIINNQNAAVAEVLPSTDWVDPDLVELKVIFQGQLETIKNEVIADINSKKYFVYDETVCARDTGLIVDALTYDILYGGNTQSIVAGLAYFDGTGANVVEGEKNETALAYKHLSAITQKIVRNIAVTPQTGNTEVQNVALPAGTLAAGDALRDLVAVLNKIVLGGANEAPIPQDPNFILGNATALNARNNIIALKKYIQDETLDYIESRLLSFNKEICARDIGLVLDCITYDIVFNSNYQTRVAGICYRQETATAVVRDFQLGPTLAAYDYVRDACIALVPGNTTAIARLNNRFDLLLDIIENGDEGAPAATFPDPVGVDADARNAILNIQANKDFIKEEITAYITQNYRSYDKVRCARDIGFIVDGVMYDMLFNSNYQAIKCGLSYRRSMSSVVIEYQIPETVGALEFVRTRVLALAAGNATAIARINNSFDIVIGIISNEAYVIPATLMTDGGLDASNDNAKDILLANKTFLQAEVIAWVNDTYPGFVYDQAKCYRDVGYIVESVAHDLTYGGDWQSIDAGIQYYYKDQLTIPLATKDETLAAIAHLSTVAQQVILNVAVTPTTGNTEVQNTSLPVSDSAAQSEAAQLFDYVYDILNNGPSTAPAITYPTITNTDPALQAIRTAVFGDLEDIKADTLVFIEENYLGFGYDQAKCQRDIGYILDAVCYDLIYGGNSQIKQAMQQYYAGGELQISNNEKPATVAAYAYMDILVQKIILNTPVNLLQTFIPQDTSTPAATVTEVNAVKNIFDTGIDILANGYTSVITLEATFRTNVGNNVAISFHQASTITSSGHTFEWIGCGVDINSALPYNGGVPIQENEVVEELGGAVYFTSTDQKGDFRIGNDLVIKRDAGTIEGRAFNKSLLGVITPYILALEG